MKILCVILILVFILSFSTSAQETKNPLAGTTWELTSGTWVREDTTITSPSSSSDQAIIIFGKTHYCLVAQDTSRDFSWFVLAKYTVDGNKFTTTFKMVSDPTVIGTSFTPVFQIEGDQLIIEASDYYTGAYKMKNYREVWSRMTSAQEKKNPLVGTTWEGISLKAIGDTTFTFPNSPYDRSVLLYGKRHLAIVQQDTSQESSHFVVGTYNYNGNSISNTIMMYPNYEDIGRSFPNNKIQIEDDKMVLSTENLHYYGYDFKTYHEEWKRID